MIKTLSPYYLSVPFVNPQTSVTSTYYTLSIHVWDGDLSAPPATPNYVITKQNPTGSTGNDEINIARILNSLIEFNPVKGTATSLLDGNNQKWIRTAVRYSDTPELLYSVSVMTTFLIRGYSYGNEGQNAQPPTNKIMMEGNEFNVNRKGVFCIPILLDTI